MGKIPFFENSKKNILSKENIKLLKNFYKNDIIKTEDILGKNLKSWYKNN